MQKTLVALLSLALLSGCGTTMSPNSAMLAGRTVGAFSADGKRAIDPPKPLPLRQAFGKEDVVAIATKAYNEAYNAKTPAQSADIVQTALEKIEAMAPRAHSVRDVVPFAKAILKAELSDPENTKRAALWPLHYIAKGLDNVDSPVFFEMTGKTMESMLNHKDGVAVGLAAMDFLKDSENGYVKTMVAKALVEFKNPHADLKEAYKILLGTVTEIEATLKKLMLKKR